MNNTIKLEHIKTVELDNDYVVIVAKKIKEEHKRCEKCEYFTNHNTKLGIGICSKHRGLVSEDDICVEVGM